MEQQQRRPATTLHEVDCRAGGLDLPLLEAGKEVGHRRFHFSLIPANACVRGNAFMPAGRVFAITEIALKLANAVPPTDFTPGVPNTACEDL